MRNTRQTFWNRVNKNSENGCWEWLGCKTQDGYGVIYFEGKRYYTHRLAWTITEGRIPDGLLVCHHCDNRICCNPSHLFVGTPKDNTHDMIKKGRCSWIVHKERKPKKVRSHRKLNPEKVILIRELFEDGYSQTRIAGMFNVSCATVSQIVNRKMWITVI